MRALEFSFRDRLLLCKAPIVQSLDAFYKRNSRHGGTHASFIIPPTNHYVVDNRTTRRERKPNSLVSRYRIAVSHQGWRKRRRTVFERFRFVSGRRPAPCHPCGY